MAIETILYTAPVPADMDADDIGIADARSNLTDVVARVRLLRRAKYLTNRGRRVAAVVPAELSEAADKVGGPDVATEILLAVAAKRA